MNREDAIHFANCLKNNYTVDLNDMEAFCNMAIKALEQEPILDKLRAEIEDMKAPDYGFAGFEDFYMCQSEVLQIIDKYKEESEE